jgi:hypothetical protein
MEQLRIRRKFLGISVSLLYISAALCIGCTTKKTNDLDADQAVKLSDTISVNDEFGLNVVDVLHDPTDEIDGCTCSYAFSKKDLLEGEFFLVSDIDTTHIMSVQKHLKRLNLLRHNDNLEVYGVDSLLVTFETLAKEDCKEEGCEAWSLEGRVTFKLGERNPITTEYFAQCGC